MIEGAARAAAVQPGEVFVRRLSPSDSLEGLTGLLHRAYRAQVEMGLRPLAGRQDVETTARRCASGECYVAVMGESTDFGPERPQSAAQLGTRLVGTILFHEVEDAKGPPWFSNRDVDSFSQFAVDPGVQGKGIGGLLLDMAEKRAVACGAAHLGLSMAEPDVALRAFYERRGYGLVEFWQWPYTNYRSAILSKRLR